MNPPRAAASAVTCLVKHGAATAAVSTSETHAELQTTLPTLRGDAFETLLERTSPIAPRGNWHVFTNGSRRAGFAVAPVDAGLEQVTHQLYSELSETTRGLHLYRIWNYVPEINRHRGDLENYAGFCRGRSLSFERAFGAEFKTRLPAASAVGTPAGPLTIAFLAGAATPRHFENPRQTPAFEYPPEYGPRSPSFARATAVHDDHGHEIFISGTAAIRGHRTIAPQELAPQLACTIENLTLIAQAAGAGARAGADDGWARSFKVYIRHRADLAEVSQTLAATLLRDTDQVQYLQADICRASLLVEIEAVLSKRS